MALLWIVLGLALGWSRAESLPDNIEALPGLIKVNTGTLYAVEEYIQVRYSLEPLTRFKMDIENEISSIERVARTISEDPVLSSEHKSLLTNATRNIISFAKWHPAYNIRKKRGLVNLVGNIQHALFGVIDERTLNERLGELNSRVDTITHSYNASAAAINTIQHNMCQLKEAVIQLNLKADQDNTTNELQHFTQLAFFISNVRAKLQDLRSQRKHIVQAIMSAARGTVEPTLITPLDIQGILQTFRQEATGQPLFTPDLSPLFYSTLSSYITPNGLAIIVPLKPASPFNVHKLYPFPTEANGIVQLASMETHETVLTNVSGALIIPREPLSELCRQPTKTTFVCMKPIWHININAPSCERAIIFRPELIEESCTYNGLKVSSIPYYVPLGDITAIYFSTPTRVTTTCARQAPTQTIQGTYILPSTCSITSKHLTLPATRTFESSFILEPPVWYPFTLDHNNTSSRGNNLNISWESMKQLDLIPKVFHDTTVDYVYPVGISMLFVALSALTIGLILWREHKVNIKRFDDVIEALDAGRYELVERLGRVACRREDQNRQEQPAA